jgi:hypothetical protein
MANTGVTIHLADIEPMTTLLAVLSDMAGDDRIPMEYKFRMCKALAPFTSEGEEKQV